MKLEFHLAKKEMTKLSLVDSKRMEKFMMIIQVIWYNILVTE